MRQYYLFIVLILTFFACQTDLLPEPDTQKDCRLTRMVQGVHDGAADDTTFLFFYDANGRLSGISLDWDTLPFLFNMWYDADGHLVKVSDEDGNLESSFTYNSNGTLKELYFSRFDTQKIVFEYDTSVLPIKSIDYRFENGQWEVDGSEVRYNFQNGNMVKEDFYLNGIYKWSTQYEYYDSIPNKSGNLPLISYNSIPLGYYQEFLFFNRNMLKKIIYSDNSEYNITYSIDSGNIAMSRGRYYYPLTGDSSQTDTRFFQFECR